MRFQMMPATGIVAASFAGLVLLAQAPKSGAAVAAQPNIDIVGIKLGATFEQATAAIKAANPALVIDVHDSKVVLPGREIRTHRSLIAHTPRGGNPSYYFGADGAFESLGVQFTFPPGPPTVQMVVRYVNFANNAPVSNTNVLEALKKKYGPESYVEGQFVNWIFDSSGKVIRGNFSLAQRKCVGMAQFRQQDIRDGGGLAQVGAPWDDATENLTSLGTQPEYSDDSATCLPYTIVRAELSPSALAGSAAGFFVTAFSPGIAHNGLAATHAAIQGEFDKLQQKQKNDASNRGVGDL